MCDHILSGKEENKMKRKTLSAVLGLALVLGALLIVPRGAAGAQGPEPQDIAGVQAALGTAFTYQGRLTDGGDLTNGTYDFEFKLYDAASGGGQVGSTITKDDVTVTDGLFTVELDFGSGAFTGDARWLEIGVRAGNSTGAYTTLTPRQPLTPAPYALALPGLRTQPNVTSPNVLGGYGGNSITAGAVGATISGGGASSGVNQITTANADYATISGGRENLASGEYATVGGGGSNNATSNHATVGGGGANVAVGEHTTIGGGLYNTTNTSGGTVGGGRSNNASGGYATVSGGRANTASGDFATVCGGYGNVAQGHYSLAIGRRAKANHDGAFVWADSTDADFASTAEDQFLVRANGGAVITGTNDNTAILGVTNLGDFAGIHGSGSSYGVFGSGNSYGIGAEGNIGVKGIGTSTGVEGSGSTGVQGTGSTYGVYSFSSSGVALYARSSSGNPIEAYGSSTLDREFYVSNTGNVYADGTFNPGGADFAEMLPAVEHLEPGDVLVVGSDGKLTRSTQAYASAVVGVYSTQPGFLGGAGEDVDLTGKIPLAVLGVVPVKASTENGAIQPGDLLVASATPGHAMKGDPNPPVGTVIGKALERLDEGSGIIQMLVMLQ
jgi:hypothetical protein